MDSPPHLQRQHSLGGLVDSASGGRSATAAASATTSTTTVPFMMTRSNTTIVPLSPSGSHHHHQSGMTTTTTTPTPLLHSNTTHLSSLMVPNNNNNNNSNNTNLNGTSPTTSKLTSSIISGNQHQQQQQNTSVINIDTTMTNDPSTVYLTINGRPSIKLTFTLNGGISTTANNNNNNTTTNTNTNNINNNNNNNQNNINNIINLLIESADQNNQNSIVGNVINNTRKYYFKGLINSIGKQPNMCEDSYFLSADYTAVGVADGVGSWRSVGVDPGEYSRSLMKTSHKLVNNYPCFKPFELIDQSYTQSLSTPGSSTICILKLLSSKMYSGLVGDSSFVLIRKDKIVHRSIEQTHSMEKEKIDNNQIKYKCINIYLFISLLEPNHPFQLGQGSQDKPTSGTYMEHDVLENDIVVIGTDGFFDNIFDEEILEAIKKVESIESFFGHLMELAKKKSTDTTVSTPIASRNSTKGGKIDDITVGCFVISALQNK
ncbi:protein phosphatase 2C-related protein [Cavenderia fasciculata]|uniref:Protein phosphatase 2C-related protein n=1 Tax=Cavenderia fasciculata TaxID=261658 RepID=F4Q4E1_CACFS|nr:protein phosphatase 2C-related protein [Cavenderia fasciculata]EGG17003.1 protein phosphatase 2C-related protein [Cavenderia fasciculata]|eukprot:XP_004355487.1 protein phosphatase 2C-related protein [Cavenderia fasciculata]